MKRLILFTLLLVSGCAMSPALKLAGFTEPALKIKRTPDGTLEFYASADFKGRADIKKDVATGQLEEVHLDFSSDPVAVTQAQGERAEHLVELRKIEAEFRLAQQQMITEMVTALVSTLKPVVGPP
jgi:hypothetical protein